MFFINNNFSYAVFPLDMLSQEAYSDFSSKEFFLYMLLLNRLNISKRNSKGFSDEKGTFIYYSTEKIMRDIRCTRNTVINILNNLEKAELIHKEYQANGLPIKIYVKDVRNIGQPGFKSETRSPPENTATYVHIENSEENKKRMRQNFGTRKIKRRT